jgi:5-dehydro-2-deoxygluconokinase
MAFDHRSQFMEMANEAGVNEERIPQLKQLLVDAAQEAEMESGLQGHMGVLIDGGKYGRDALARATGRGWWVGRPVELPSSRPLRFDGTRSIGSGLIHWPSEQVVKCLVFYHPDDSAELRLEQEDKVLELWEATRESGNELLLEIILPKDKIVPGNEDADVLRVIQRFYNIGIKPEWWKLAPMQQSGWGALKAMIDEQDPYCRGAVILGLNQPLEFLAKSFSEACNPVVKGFMVGRSVWADASLQWFKGAITDVELQKTVKANFAFLVNAWRQRHEKQ